MDHLDHVTEGASSNLFAVRSGRLVTPPLSAGILEGITRHSVIRLLEDDGVKVVERDISLAELCEGAVDGEVAEVFACGTAAVLTPVGQLKGPSFDVTVGDGSAGEVTSRIRGELMDIQYGRAADPYGWMRRVG